MKIVVLYEDQRGPIKEFGLHALVVSLVHDVIGGERAEIKAQLEDRPQKGDSKLVKACRDLVGLIGWPTVAVFDLDKIRHHLKLPAKAKPAAIMKAICEGKEPGSLKIMFLDRNMESAVEVAADCLELDPDLRARAIDQKDLTARDQILNRAAWAGREIRDCIIAGNDSLEELRDLLVSLLREDAAE